MSESTCPHQSAPKCTKSHLLNIIQKIEVRRAKSYNLVFEPKFVKVKTYRRQSTRSCKYRCELIGHFQEATD